MEKNHKYGFRKHKAVKGLGVALLGTVGVLAGSSLVSANEVGISEAVQTNRTIDATISRVDYNELTEEQKAHIKSGMIDEQLSWINPETGNLEWITGFVAVYKSTGDCQVIPIDPKPIEPNVTTPPTPGSNIPVLPLTPNNQPVSKVTGIPRKSNLPKTGLVGSKIITVAGLGLLTFGGYLLFKNRKTGKHVAIALLVAGGVGVSSPVLANSRTFLDLVENVTLQLNSRFTHTPESDPCWEYIGYYPEIASVPAETPTSPNTLTSADLKSESQEHKGKVTVHYVDENGNIIADSKELVNAVVSTTYRTKVTINGLEKAIENTVPTEVDYDTSALKVNTIL
ncbi:TPA: MucBP domain-containing protein, partial [Streptococcus suis]